MVLNCKVRMFVLALLMTGGFEMSAADSLRTERVGDQYFVVHRVEKGETLYSLSKRYNSLLDRIIQKNEIVGNQISPGQEIMIPIEGKSVATAEKVTKKYHKVTSGETLYAISRQYGVTIDDLRLWNNLSSSEISVGQSLVVSRGASVSATARQGDALEPRETVVDETSIAESTGESEAIKEEDRPEASKIPDGFRIYYVQNGELLSSIAQKFNVRPDSIVIWNDLPNTYLSIGQKLLIKGEIDAELQKKAPKIATRPYGTIRKTKDPSGFIRIFEEGVASKIDGSVETEKYLALHRTLPIGTLVEVRNLMNNQKVFARVVGKLPETGLNKNVLVRLTPVCFERLGVIDAKARVEVSYYED